MTIIFFILFLITVIQIILILRKKSQSNHNENLDRVNELIGYLQNDSLSATDCLDRNILMIAVSSHFFPKKGELSFVDVMKKAIESGINVDIKNKSNGKSALFYAIETKYNDECVDYLLQAGANPNITDNKGRTPLFEAVKKSRKKYDLIVNKTEDINHQNLEGVTPLMVAAKYMPTNTIHDLLDRGANVALTNKVGDNAYDIAKKYAPSNYIKIRESNTDEGNRHDMSNSEKASARKHNHEITEVIRRLKCIMEGNPFTYKKFKKHGIF
ncbi:ankyrin repeat domain-containing protein [Clostridium sp. DL1XJH146]